MVLRSGYMALALSLQEAATKDPDKFKAKLDAALAAETEDGPWKSFLEAGARHSASDMGHLQAIHDASMVLGATCGGVQEAAAPNVSELKLVESARCAEFIGELNLQESSALRTNYPIRIIDPGEGSSAVYNTEVLQREAHKFKPGTLMFWNHPTSAEDAARPEGNLDNLAAITTSQGVWNANGPKGPGIYAEAKVMADYAEKVAERAPHIGLSIRAGGIAESGRKVNGKPVLKEFTHIESVDYVTKAGRGGLALAEAARDAGLLPIHEQEAAEMTADEAKKLIEAAVSAATAPLIERAMRGDAQSEGVKLLESVNLPAAAKTRIIERATQSVPTKDGAFDVDAFRALVVAEAKTEGEYIASITGSGRVTGFGIPAPAPLKPEDVAAREASQKQTHAEAVAVFESLGMSPRAAEFAAKGRAN